MSTPAFFRPSASDRVLARAGRSFHFASRFLSREHAGRAARLYAFCRYVDDLADLSSDPGAARDELTRIERDLASDRRIDPRVDDLLDLARETGLSVAAARQLVSGVRSDAGRVEIADVRGLLRYGYRVAGTVGLMMCPVLGTTDPRAVPFAIDLGIAMQLTNIARDVIEDARAGRRYLPGNWVGDAAPETIAGCPEALQPHVCHAVRRLLLMADRYYASGEAGLVYLEPRPRLAIAVAARVYRAIGLELERRDFAPWRGRAVVPTAKKVALASEVLLAEAGRRRSDAMEHDASLHHCLAGLPGAIAPTSWRWAA